MEARAGRLGGDVEKLSWAGEPVSFWNKSYEVVLVDVIHRQLMLLDMRL